MSAEPSEAVRQTLEKNREASEKSRAEADERTKGKPTPTQEENDLAALGHHVAEHEDDGSGPELVFGPMKRDVEPAKKPAGAGYQTRASAPIPQRTTHKSE